MRCPSCGTQNEADSRFCGGCGARLTTSRLAPTQKIADNAPLQPAPTPGRTPSLSQPPPVQPMAPSVNRPPRGASGNVQPIPQVAPPAPASVSLPVPQRRWGLVIGVLVIDLGLAAAGVWMLSQGLASSEPTSTTTGSGSAAVQTGVIEGTVPRPRAAAALRDGPPPTTPTVTPIETGTFVSPPPAAAIAPPPSTATEPPTTTATTDLDPPAPPPADVTPAASPPPRAVRKKQRTNRHPASAPLDPYTE